MVTFTNADCAAPSKLFWFLDQVKWRPHSLTLNPSNRNIVDNAGTHSLDFTYLVAYRLSVLIYRSEQRIRAEVYRLTRFSRQFGYHKQLPMIVDSSSFVETRFIRATIYWCECICRLTGSSLKVSKRHLVLNFTILYACWWHGIAGATCTAAHISGLLAPSKRKGQCNLGTNRCSGSILPPGVRRGEVPKAHKFLADLATTHSAGEV